jgi:flagellar hook-length control protein FliK
MLDLTYFILNSSSLTEPSLNAQDILRLEQPVELTDELVDSNNLIIDPSSFVLLFAEILANTPVKSNPEPDSDSSAPASSPTFASSTMLNSSTKLELANKEELADKEILTNKIDLTRIENQISTQNELPITSDGRKATTDTEITHAAQQNNATTLLLNIPLNTTDTDSEPEQLFLNRLENNVAMAWINSDSFHPPQPVVTTSEPAEEVLPELAALLREPKESSEVKLKKDASSGYDKILDPLNTKAPINSQEEWPKSLQLPTSASISSAKINGSNIKQQPQTDSIQTEQYVIQPDALVNKESQRAIEMPLKSLEIPVDLANSQWANKFSEHIIWLGHQGIKSALIKIHPEDLGPLEISIKVVKDSASININSHSSHVRDLVDQALPKLREMMSEQGLNLSDVHIGSDTNARQFSHHSAPAEEAMMMGSDDEVQLTPLAKRTQEGIIDYFA